MLCSNCPLTVPEYLKIINCGRITISDSATYNIQPSLYLTNKRLLPIILNSIHSFCLLLQILFEDESSSHLYIDHIFAIDAPVPKRIIPKLVTNFSEPLGSREQFSQLSHYH